MDDATWERRKRAVRDFAKMRPRLITDDNWEPTPDSKAQSFPTLVFGVQQMAYGVWAPLFDVLSDIGGNLGWSDEAGQLYLTPAPALGTTIQVVWKAEYTVDPELRRFPDLPSFYEPYIDDLAKAIELEDTAEQSLNQPSEYSIGQKTFKRGANNLTQIQRAHTLRDRVAQALGEPLADWE
jgi:hypothetical protein